MNGSGKNNNVPDSGMDRSVAAAAPPPTYLHNQLVGREQMLMVEMTVRKMVNGSGYYDPFSPGLHNAKIQHNTDTVINLN